MRRRRRLPVVPLTLLAAVLAPLLIQLALGHRKPELPEEYAQSTLAFTGLDCAVWCPIQVGTALRGLPGVLSSSVDVRSGQVRVRYDQQRVSEREIVERVEGGDFHFLGASGRSVTLRFAGATFRVRWRPPGWEPGEPGRLAVSLDGPGSARVRVEIGDGGPDSGPTLRLESTTQPEQSLELPTRSPGTQFEPIRLQLRRNGQQKMLELPLAGVALNSGA